MEKPTLLQKYDISSDEEGNNYIGGVKNEEKIKSKWTEKEDVLIENEFTIKPRQIKLLTKKQKREENENLTKINKEKDNEKSKMKIFQYIEPNNSSLSPVIIWSLTPSKDGKLQGKII